MFLDQAVVIGFARLVLRIARHCGHIHRHGQGDSRDDHRFCSPVFAKRLFVVPRN